MLPEKDPDERLWFQKGWESYAIQILGLHFWLPVSKCDVFGLLHVKQAYLDNRGWIFSTSTMCANPLWHAMVEALSAGNAVTWQFYIAHEFYLVKQLKTISQIMSPCLTFSKMVGIFRFRHDAWGEVVLAAGLKLQGPRPLAESWPPLSVVKDKEVVKAGVLWFREGFRCLLPCDESCFTCFGTSKTSKTFTRISSNEARLNLESYSLSSKVLWDISFSVPIAMQSQQQKACKNCPCDDYSRDVLMYLAGEIQSAWLLKGRGFSPGAWPRSPSRWVEETEALGRHAAELNEIQYNF